MARNMKTRIKEYRAKLNLTQEELAKLVDVRRETIIYLEQGKYNPSLELAYKVSKALKAKIEELKMLFGSKPLRELERLKFKIEDIEEPRLSDLNGSTTIKETTSKHNGVELPPTNGKIDKEIQKEEV